MNPHGIEVLRTIHHDNAVQIRVASTHEGYIGGRRGAVAYLS